MVQEMMDDRSSKNTLIKTIYKRSEKANQRFGTLTGCLFRLPLLPLTDHAQHTLTCHSRFAYLLT